MKHLIIILLALVVSSCCSYEKCMDKYPPTVETVVTQSNDTVERWHDSLVRIPADSSWFRSWLRCDSLGNVYMSEIIGMQTGHKMKQSVTIKDNMLYVSTKIDSAAIYFAWKELIIRNTKNSVTKVSPPKPQIRSPTKWQQFKNTLATVWNVVRIIWDVGWLIFVIMRLIGRYLNKKIPNF